MPKRLIINSDDYGRTPEVSRGIREAHLRGVVTSTTCMMNIPTTAADIAIALRETPRLGLGVHLVLTADSPIVPRDRVSSITDENGRFLKLSVLTARLDQVNINEVREEWHAQVDAFIAAAGRQPTHLDSHHHSSYFSPALFRAMLELAKEYDCAIRVPGVDGLPPEADAMREFIPRLINGFSPRRPDAFFANFYDEPVAREELLRIINNLPEGASEIMCHPGYVDETLLAVSSYARQREAELDILTDASIKDAIHEKGIELIGFAGL